MVIPYRGTLGEMLTSLNKRCISLDMVTIERYAVVVTPTVEINIPKAFMYICIPCIIHVFSPHRF
jgi:hypothetical protein